MSKTPLPLEVTSAQGGAESIRFEPAIRGALLTLKYPKAEYKSGLSLSALRRLHKWTGEIIASIEQHADTP